MGRIISIIYKMTHLPTGKFYIGSLKDSSRLARYSTSSKYVRAMILDNHEEWIKEIIETFDDIPFYDVVVKEQMLIQSSVERLGWERVFNKFYHNGVAECYSPETIARRLAVMRSPEKRKKASESSVIQMSKPGAKRAVTEGQMGEKNHFYGKHHSEAHIERLRTNNPSSNPEVGAKIAAAQRGRKKMRDLEGNDKRVKAEQIEDRLKDGWTLVGSG